MKNLKPKKMQVVVLVLLMGMAVAVYEKNYAVEGGEEYQYKITQARINAKIGINSFHQKGFEVGNILYKVGTIATCKITKNDEGSLDYNITVGDQKLINYLVSNWIILWDDYYAIYTTIKTFELIEDWRNIAGFGLFFFRVLPYVHQDYYNSGVVNEFEEALNSRYNKTETLPKVQTQLRKEVNDDLILFESWVGGEVEGTIGEQFEATHNYDSEFTFGNNFHILYENTSGIVQGMGYRGWIEGIIDNKSVKVAIEYQFELVEGNSLPKYQLGENKNFRTTIITIAIVIPITMLTFGIITLAVIRKKGRRRR